MDEKIFVAKERTSQQILAEVLGQRPKRYGFRVRMSEPNPEKRVEYLYDAQDMTPAHMDFAAGEFKYGSWSDVWFVKNNFPCMVKANGAVDYQLDPNNYAKRADNGEDSDVDREEYNGNAMSAIPCVWYKRWTDGDCYYFVACEEQYDGSFCADVHTDQNGSVQPYKYAAMFEGSLDGNGALRSLSGKRPACKKTAADELAYAQANGSAWTIREWGVWCLIADLLILMGKSTNTQEVYGNGHVTGRETEEDLLTTGTLDTAGQFFGSSDTVDAVKVFHLENWWGDRWERIVGMVVVNGIVKVKMNSCGGDYNFTGDNYETVGNILPDTAGWQEREYSGRLGTFPTAAGGSASTYECDYFNINKDIVSVARVGGECSGRPQTAGGARYLDCRGSATTAPWNMGASLSLKNPS